MNNHGLFSGTPGPDGKDARLADWLQQVLAPAPLPQVQGTAVSHEQENQNQLAIQLSGDYHLTFYRQLSDLALAVLQKDASALPRYASVLYHLLACQECHTAYIDIYVALQEALYPQSARPLLGQGTRTLTATPHRMLSHLCQLLISQAEAELMQARHTHTNNDVSARSLLQMALRVSAHITQGTVRREALQDLVRVATLFDGAATPPDTQPAHSYTPALASGMRGGKVFRRSDAPIRMPSSDADAIEIQSRALTGRIVQRGQTLELYLYDLGAELRGRHVVVSVLLGSLLEPVRWRGGNPRAIRSTSPVDASGELVMSLGETEMQLRNREERNLLEAMFLLLEVRPADMA